MSNYVKSTNFTVKDSLPSGNANKVVRGAEIDTEFNNIQVHMATKAEKNDPELNGTLTGNVVISGGTY